MPRYLTKSRFKLGLECPTKLFYTKKEEYFDQKLEDGFLQSLAEGGFQVGELAKLYYPGGINIDELDYDVSLARTNDLLQQSDVIIYEAAFLFKTLFIRADLIVKKGNNIELIEVKAKSFDPENDSFLNRHGFISPNWSPYLYDAAFQKYVVENAFPSYNVSAFLLLADKSKTASVDGLNQKFHIYSSEGRKQIKVKGPTDQQSLGERILTLQNIDPILDKIYQGDEVKEKSDLSFTDRIDFFAERYAADMKIDAVLGSHCGSCEFRMEQDDADAGRKSGFHECWKEQAGFTYPDFLKPSVLDIWNFKKKKDCIQQGIYFQDKSIIERFKPANPSKKDGPGLSQWERQVLQIEKSIANDQNHFIDIPSLTELEAKWKFPYHFIDFETTAVAIPFTSGRRPYETIAFQFSHHIMNQDGKTEHKGQWISAEPGFFPNFEFVRALKKELDQDEGTIFRYAPHENAVLNAIYKQLQSSQEEDRSALCDWVREITHSGRNSQEEWVGARDMVDLKDVIQKFYYDPLTKGSISIKKVLPAILNSCGFLKEKYAWPIYGKEIKSLNFTEQQWIRFSEDKKLINPYQLLPPVYEDIENSLLDTSIANDDTGIYDGGAAMSAYATLQFTELGTAEREKIISALLKYCELDTFAMVLIWEGLAHWIHTEK